ncbi:MAG: VOC family protein [Alphaproteobacteria bacterium]|nr:VOC family protein [Alphaproteobacteria bacterium]
MRVHLNLPTLDLEAAVTFYSALLGEGPDKRRPGFARFAPSGVPIALSLTAADSLPADEARRHLGLRAGDAEELEAAWRRLDAAGALRDLRRGDTCCWATQDKAWACDPDGREWEIYIVTDEAPAVERSPSTSCCPSGASASACCA